MSCEFPLYSHLRRDLLKGSLGRVVSIALILFLSAGSGSPVLARELAGGLSVLQVQARSLSSFLPTLGISPRGAAQQIENRGMPPDPPQSEGIRPQPPQSRRAREARVARLSANLNDRVTLTLGESMQLMAVPEDEDGNPVHGVVAEWESRNSQTVVVTPGGEATAVGVGVAPLTATVGQKSTTLVVTVEPTALTSANQVQNSGARELAIRSRISRQQGTRNPSTLFAHRPATAMLPPLLPIGMGDAEQLYEPRNAVGAPPGRTTPGATTPGTAIGTIETPGSANFSFDLGVISLPGRNQSLDFDLTYNSRIWTKSLGSPTQMTYNMDAGWIAPGFLVGYGYLDNQSDGTGKQFMITDSNGTRHRMVNVPVGSNNYESNDGTFIKLTVNGTQVTEAVATFPGGQQLTYTVGDVSIATRYHPTQVTDRNGNFITIAYAGASSRGPKIFSIRDTLGRYLCFKYSGNDLIAISAPGLTGQAERPIIRFYYENISGLNQAGLFQSGIVVNAPPGGTARVVKYIYLPNATETANAHIGYRYDYSSYGMMYKITQSRGMTISTAANDYTQAGTITNEGTLAAQTTYNYHGTPANPTTGIASAPFYTTRTDDWAGRTSAQPVYTFSVNEAAGLSTVTAPDGTISETHSIVSTGFDKGLIDRMTIKVGSTVWSDTVYSWEPSPSPQQSIPRLNHVRITNEAVPAQTRAVVFTYDLLTPYNNISKMSERDFTTNGTVSATELRRTETTYVTDSSYTNRGLISLPASVKIFPGGSVTAIAQTDYSYDQFGLAAAPGIIMYTNPGTTARGNLTTTRTYPDITIGNYVDHTATYDIAGNVITAQLDCCQQKSFVYSSAYFYAYLTSVTTGTGPTLTTSAIYDLNTGLTGTVTDENLQQTSFFYHVDSLRPEHVEFADGGRNSYTYNDALTPNASGLHYYSCVTTRLDATNSVQSYSFYDGRGAVAQTFDNWTSANLWSTQDIEYDVMGRAFRAGNPYYSSGYSPSNPINPTGFWTTRTFDNLSRIKILTMPTGDSNPASTTTVQTNYAGTVITVTDQAGKQRRQITDGLGRVIRLHEPDVNGNLGTVSAPAQPTSYEYDALDNLIHITQGGVQHRYFKYDSLSRVTHERQVEQDAPFTTPDSVAGNNQWSRKVIYNSHGLVTDAYDARQINTHIGYDGLNRPLQITYSNGTPTVNYTYDQARTGFFNQGRLTTVATAAVGQAPSTTQEFDYERTGRVASQRQKIGPATYALAYSYNLAGLLLSERYPSNRRVNYVYDGAGRLATVADSAGVPYANGFTYEPHGGLASETFGNAAVHLLSYNSRLQASQVKLKQNASGAELQRFDYAYGQATQSTGAIDATKNNGQIGRVDGFISGTKQWDERFTYDSLGRLSQAAEYRGDNGQLTWQAHYDYDAYGNRFQYQQNINLGYNTVLPSDVDDSRNRFISTGATPTGYDAAGNILSDAKFRGLSYAYDANNRQTSASGTGVSQTAVYDAMGQRVQTSASGLGRQMVYDAFGQIVAEYGGSSLQRENVYRGGQLLTSQEFFTPAAPPKNVTWTNVSSTVQVTGNSIQKVSGTNAWDAGAVSSQLITGGDGYMEFTPGETATYRMCGLGNTDSSAYYADIDYAFFIYGGGGLSIYESGIDRGSFGTYAAGDRLKVAVEGGVVKYYRNSTLLYTSTVAPTYPLQVDTSLNTVNAGVYNVVITSDLQNVTWTNVSSTVQVTGNSIQKTSGTSSWYDAGAVSSQLITAGDGYMEFTPGETGTYRMCGLGNTDSSAYYADIDYAFFIYGGGGLSIYESGSDRGSFGTNAAGDRLKVAVEGGVVKYYRNATLLYTSTVAPTYPLQVDTSLNTVNAGVYNVVITSDLQNVSWTNVSSTVQATGNSIQKVSGSNSWYDAGAVSSQQITAGDGYMEFTPGETGTYRMCGLGNTDSSAYYADIDYAFFIYGGGGLSIYESGSDRGSFGTYAAGDRLKVAVEGGVVKYYRNATLLYTSTVAPTYPLQVDTSLNTVNAGVYNVVVSGARLTASPVNYVLQDVQGSTRAVMSGTSVIARHDFQPFGEEIAPGIGMRTWGQGFSLPDKIRQRYAMTERDDATGLDHTWWRKYENRSGRWTSPDPYTGSISLANPQSFNRFAYVQGDSVNLTDPSGLFACLTCPDEEDGGGYPSWWDQWDARNGGPDGTFPRGPRGEPLPRGGGGPRPQNPVLPVVSEQKYNDCLKHLGNAPAPPYGQATAIVGTSALEGTDATLLAVTWTKEASFNFWPVSNYRPEDGGWDVGPLQTSTTYYDKSPFTDGLPNPFGTTRSETVAFNGNSHSSLRVGARALNEVSSRSRSRGDAAGLYRAGSRKPASYRIRANEFKSLSKGYDAFFNCLKK